MKTFRIWMNVRLITKFISPTHTLRTSMLKFEFFFFHLFSISISDEREELNCYLGRITTRLATVALNVTTIRDQAQEDSLHQVNGLIDSVITTTDRIAARLHCQHYLNCCSDGGGSAERVIDKKFEMALLGCALDDQKNIKKRLQALMTYLNKQIIADE